MSFTKEVGLDLGEKPQPLLVRIICQNWSFGGRECGGHRPHFVMGVFRGKTPVVMGEAVQVASVDNISAQVGTRCLSRRLKLQGFQRGGAPTTWGPGGATEEHGLQKGQWRQVEITPQKTATAVRTACRGRRGLNIPPVFHPVLQSSGAWVLCEPNRQMARLTQGCQLQVSAPLLPGSIAGKRSGERI